MARPQPRYKKGDRIGGRYQVYKALMGGMGEVYLCLDLEQNYPFALKTFQQRYQSSALRTAFEQEVATWVALEKHPNIVRCFHTHTLDNRPFMVLEWIAGEDGKESDLRGWLRHGSLDLRTALNLTIDIVRGLIHAQKKQPGLVHRDLKPENILVAQGGLAKITDFGLAQIVEQAGLEVKGEADGRQSLVGKSGIAGTPAYMAPEQWQGKTLDERTDIYAIGCILYEMLSGRCPFQVDFSPTTPQQIQLWLTALRDQHESSVPLSLPALIPTTVNDLVTSCLAKSPTQRPKSLAEFLDHLEYFYRRHFTIEPRALPPVEKFMSIDHNNRGTTYAALHRYEEALADYGRAIELDPADASPYSNRGITYHELQRYPEALASYGRAIELSPTYALAYSNRGNTYHQLRRYEEALVDFGKAIDLDPTFVLAYANRGITHHELQRYPEALADYNRAIELNSTYALAYANRGNTYVALHQYEQALTDFGQALEFNPTLASAYRNRGNTYIALQKYEDALVDYGQLIELDPTNAKIYFNRGNTYFALQRYDEAVADFERAIELDPTDSTAFYNRGATYAALQQHDKALADFGRAIALDPTDASAYGHRGNTYNQLQRYEEALADFGRAIALDPKDTIAYGNRGNTYSHLQCYDKALINYNQAIELDPTDAYVFFNRGNTYYALHRYDEALADFERAIDLAPSFASMLAPVYVNIGLFFVRQNKLYEALSCFEKASKFGDAPVKEKIAQISQDLGVSLPTNLNLTQVAFDAFQQTASLADMQRAVARFPFITQPNFITASEQAIAQQVPPEHRPHFEQRLAWLKQIAQEQHQ